MAYTTIDKPTDYFNTVLYTGTGSATSITGVGFQPDWVWIKRRSDASSHRLVDVVRGATNYIESDTTDAEGSTGNVSSFDSDGFSHSAGGLAYNASGSTYVAWNWLADNTSGSSNSDGSITSTVSANTTAGFSIVSWTGTGSAGTIGHGLGATPVMGIFKNRTDAATNWRVWHQGITNTQILELSDTTAAGVPGTADFNIANNTIDVWGLATNNQSNGSGDSMIAYIFAEKKGFSKFGSYTGNGNADGTFVYTGFKPAWVMYKVTSAINSWVIQDTKRSTFNVMDDYLLADNNNAEGTSSVLNIDFLSNGFKHRNSSNASNASGGTYIYMAFAENPFVTSTGIPGTAR